MIKHLVMWEFKDQAADNSQEKNIQLAAEKQQPKEF